MSNKIIKDALALTLITLVAGVALGAVHGITEEPIKKQEAMAKEEAYSAVFSDADGFEQVQITKELSAQLRENLDVAGYGAQSINEIQQAVDGSGESLGYAFLVTTSEGYGGDIQFSMGVKSDGTLNGISILSISETAGLGMNANTDEFKNQFADKNVEKFTYTKNGAKEDSEIDAISGATVTTNAMTNGVNAGLCAYQMMEGGE
ncbi:MAG: RnfABCDGE type electron transport complex subunit G [Clostridia bacterium]|nr:RnfABCDGE type electron transport complex subunit G [Clostridia bacterium]NCC43480.1 RnfABCDGE type electron transport complex subunit G [Clostridia bacterium]